MNGLHIYKHRIYVRILIQNFPPHNHINIHKYPIQSPSNAICNYILNSAHLQGSLKKERQ